MTFVPPVNPVLLSLLAQGGGQMPMPQGQLVTLVAQLVQLPQGLQTLTQPLQINGVVQQQTAGQQGGGGQTQGDVLTLTVQTPRGPVMIALDEAFANAITAHTGGAQDANAPVPVRITLTPQPNNMPPLVHIAVEETLIKSTRNQHAPTSPASATKAGQPMQSIPMRGTAQMPPPMAGAPQGGQTPIQSPAIPVRGGSVPMSFFMEAQEQQSSTPTAAPLAQPLKTGAALRLNFINLPADVAQNPQAMTRATSVLTQVVHTDSDPAKPASVPLGQVGLTIVPQTKLADGTMTGIVAAQTKPIALPDGTQVQLTGQRVVIPATLSEGAPMPKAITVSVPETWPEGVPKPAQAVSVSASAPLGRAITELAQSMPDESVPQLLQMLTAQPTDAGRAASPVMMLWSILRGSDAQGREHPTLEQTISNLHIMGRVEGAAKLGEAVAQLAASVQEDGTGVSTQAPAPWRSIPLPIAANGMQDAVQSAWLHVHLPPDRARDDDAQSGSKRARVQGVDRFIFDLALSRMGQMQIDGLVREKSVSVVLKSEQSMTRPMQAEIEQRFVAALQASGFDGALRFQVVPLGRPEWTPWDGGDKSASPVDRGGLTA